MKKYDIVLIGAGIVGLASAMKLLKKKPNLTLCILEKEQCIAKHQTGHNSGVIHSGIYYKPGSLKAKNCAQGIKQLLTFCDENNIKYDICGKVIVATKPGEIERLRNLYKRGIANGLQGLKILSKEQLRDIEPHAYGLEALHVPQTGIVDYVQVADVYAKNVLTLGGEILFNRCVTKISSYETHSVVITKELEIEAKLIINCAGLQSDYLSKKVNHNINFGQIIPFRGEYYHLSEEKKGLLKGLIYPVPDPRFPFLGVHLTRTINGDVEVGPNAILALSKEGYSKTDINFIDLIKILKFKGFWKMSTKYWIPAFYETYRSFSKNAFVKDVQKLFPEVLKKDLKRNGSGVRAQLVTPNGKLIDDFYFSFRKNVLNVLNAPSPGATASLSIGEYIAEKALDCFD